MARPLAEVIGENLRLARKRAHLSQESLGQLVHIEAATLSRYENGHLAPRFATLGRLAATLKVRVKDLVGEEGARAAAPRLPRDQTELLRDYEALPAELRRVARQLLRGLRKASE
jgi:transcriptional regulator with XRE-family HTH domain